MVSMGVKRGLLIGLVVCLGMAGCKPAILDAMPVSTQIPLEATALPVLQVPTPVCQVFDEAALSPADPNYGYPPETDTDWIEGNANALITFVFYGDFLCPYSADLDGVLATLVEEYTDEFRVVFRQLPIQNSYLPALAIEAASMQSIETANPLRHHLFAHQVDWIQLTGDEFITWLKPYLVSLELDAAQFEVDILSDKAQQNILDDLLIIEEMQITGSPFVLINDKPYTGIRDEESLRDIIRSYQQVNAEDIVYFDHCPDQVIDVEQTLRARITTTRGAMMVDLYTAQAPFTVNNFVFLAEQGWYDDSPIFRVIPGTVLQTGDPTGTGSGTTGYEFGNEINPELAFDQPGVLAMANAGSQDPISNSGQFFITYGPAQNYTGGYTIFGKIIAGLEVLDEFPAVEPAIGEYVNMPDRILSIEILEVE